MLSYLDIYPVELPCRYQDKIAQYDIVYIITNIPLENNILKHKNLKMKLGKRSVDELMK